MEKDYNLAGMRFGKLTVLKEHDEHYITSKGLELKQWVCLCDCGQEKIAHTRALKYGWTKSCGCLKMEIARQNGRTTKQHNVYDLDREEYGIGYTSKGEEFWFDKEDYDKIKDYCWHYGAKGYLVTKFPNQEKKVRFHRFVMNANDDEYVDHIIHPTKNENKYDNRKSNLRKVSNSQNCMNRHLHSNNTSGVTGVFWREDQQVWKAIIGYNNQQIHLGSFKDFEDAVAARKAAEEQYFREFSFDNSQQVLN